MKKGLSVIVLTLFILMLSACELFEEQSGNVTISFVTNTHTTLHPLTYEKGQTIELPELHETEDMVFAGWYLDSEKTVPATNLDNQSEDFTVYAKWDLKQYDILIDIYKEVSVNRILMNEIAMFIINDQGQLHVQKTQDNPLAIESGWQDAPVLEPSLSGTDDDNDIILDAWEMNAFLVSPDGSVYAWGDNTYGQLGTDDKVSRGTFVEITDHIPLVIDERVIKMVGNQTTTFALTNQGRVFAWGSNHANMLLDKTLTESVIPKDITDDICGDTDHFLVDIVVSSDHAIALTAEHQVLVWGFEATGWFGGDDVIVVRDNASNISENVYRFFDTHVVHMTAERDTIILVSASDQILIMGTSKMASDHTLLVIEGDEYGFVTNPDASGKPTIIDVQIAGDTAIFQYSDGTLIGLGDNTTGLIASKKGYDAYVAKAQMIPTNFAPESLSTSSSEACAVSLDDGSVWCWGNNTVKSVGRNNELILSTAYQYVAYDGHETDYDGTPEDPASLRSSAGPIYVLSPPETLVEAPFARPHVLYDVIRFHIGGITADTDLDAVLKALIANVCTIGDDCDDADPSIHPDAYLISQSSDHTIRWTMEVRINQLDED